MKTWETVKSGILWIPDRICNCFTSLRSIKQAKKAIFGIFPDFRTFLGILGVQPSGTKSDALIQTKSEFTYKFHLIGPKTNF